MSSEVTGRFKELHTAAYEAMQRAYAPYSNYPVGCAARTTDGRVITGCNVENASYGVGLCAECALVGQLQLTGGGELEAFLCVNAQGTLITPCGRCRQLLNEFAGETLEILTTQGVTTIEALLPESFGPRDLQEVRS